MPYRVYQGESASFTFTVTDADEAAMAVTGYTVTFVASRSGGDSVTLDTTSNPTQVELDTPEVGTITVTLSATDTAALGPAPYETFIKVDDGAGGIETEEGELITIVADPFA